MITNFFSRAALVKVASLHSLQKPSALSIGAARAAPASESARTNARMRIMASPGGLVARNIVRSRYWLKHTGL